MNKLENNADSLDSRLEGRLRVWYMQRCPSTSSQLREWIAEGQLDGPLLLCTDDQYGGRGTRGRSWEMQQGQDLAFSLALPLLDGLQPSSRLPLALSVLLAQALGNLIREQWRAARLFRQEDDPDGEADASQAQQVTRAINEARDGLALRLCAVKWPNDLLLARRGNDGDLQYRKCGGILTEAMPGWLLIGIGINVNSSAADFGPELAGTLTTVRDCCGMQLDREALFGGLVMRLYGRLVFNGILHGYSETDDSAIRELEQDWRELDRTPGQLWRLKHEGREFPVTATHVDFASGQLHVRDEAGGEYVVESYSELESV